MGSTAQAKVWRLQNMECFQSAVSRAARGWGTESFVRKVYRTSLEDLGHGDEVPECQESGSLRVAVM